MRTLPNQSYSPVFPAHLPRFKGYVVSKMCDIPKVRQFHLCEGWADRRTPQFWLHIVIVITLPTMHTPTSTGHTVNFCKSLHLAYPHIVNFLDCLPPHCEFCSCLSFCKSWEFSVYFLYITMHRQCQIIMQCEIPDKYRKFQPLDSNFYDTCIHNTHI